MSWKTQHRKQPTKSPESVRFARTVLWMYRCILPELCIQFAYKELWAFCFIRRLGLMSFIKRELTRGQEQSFYFHCGFLQLLGRMCSVHKATQLLQKAAVNISNMHRCLLWQLITGFLLKWSATCLLPINTVYYKIQKHSYPSGFGSKQKDLHIMTFISQSHGIRHPTWAYCHWIGCNKECILFFVFLPSRALSLG